uniref:minor capsid protein n=1 Tax=Pseudomonas sp. TMP9 TaxID=3133144 RepID=UPI00403F9B3D
MLLRSVKHKPQTAHGKQHRKLMLGRLKAAKAVKETHPYIRWIAVEDLSSCTECRLLHGKHFSVMDSAWKDCLPPIHENCRCRIVGARKLPDDTFAELLLDFFDT